MPRKLDWRSRDYFTPWERRQLAAIEADLKRLKAEWRRITQAGKCRERYTLVGRPQRIARLQDDPRPEDATH